MATFLSAGWYNLAIANYIIPPEALAPYLPSHTELDLFEGKCYASLVGFMFQQVRVRGFRIPWHVNFQEVNLRFYVTHKLASGELRRGVVFIKEIVPKRAITFVANTLYKENYETMPMNHAWEQNDNRLFVSYQWYKQRWHGLEVIADKQPQLIAPGSKEEFITEHYWGYARVREGLTTQYEVTHPKWLVHPVQDFKIDVDFGSVYGADFSFLAQVQPESVFLAEGSPIKVMGGARIRNSH